MKNLLIISLAVVMMVFSVSLSSTSAATLFTDVTEKTSSYDEINYLVKQGIIQSDSNSTYGVKENATRYDIVYLLVQALKLKLPETIEVSPFPDIALDDERLPYIVA